MGTATAINNAMTMATYSTEATHVATAMAMVTALAILYYRL